MCEHQRPSHRIGTCCLLCLLLLLLFTCQRVKADVSIDDLRLSFHPSPNVQRDTNVTIKCHASVSRSSGFSSPQYAFSIKKDNKELHRTLSTSNTYDYPIEAARVSDSGSYQCFLSIEGKSRSSEREKLKVTGTHKAVIRVDRSSIQEGDEVTVTCAAPGERGSFIFFFYVDNKEVRNNESSSEEYSVQLRLKHSGPNNLTCDYTIRLFSESVPSAISRQAIVVVREIDISVLLTISPSMTIIEADNFSVSCMVNSPNKSESVLLIKGSNILSTGKGKTDYGQTAGTGHSGEYMCKVEINGVFKIDKKMLTVKELFSRPTLTSSPPEAFEGDFIRLSCQSTNVSLESIRKEIKYSIFKDGNRRSINNENGQMTARAGPSADGNYTCLAEAKLISKESPVIVIRSKVLASKPEISVKDKVILDRPFQIQCKSNGTLPIKYTLFEDDKVVYEKTVHHPREEALFATSISRKEHIHKFLCRAQNSPRVHVSSQPLKAFVVEPLGKPLLTTLPVPDNVEEGSELILICNVPSGTPPITFKWYWDSSSSKAHLHTSTVNANSSYHTIQWMERMDSGEYFCEAVNPANNVKSDPVTIHVKLASWKKVLIGAIFLLVVIALILVFIVRCRAKRGKREAATELSVKPASPKSDDSLAVNMGLDTPFLNKVGVDIVPSVWTDRQSSSDSSSDRSRAPSHNGPDVEYTEVVHPQPLDPARGEDSHTHCSSFKEGYRHRVQ
ncbi:platelet endothelial cell adhesion molecule isoform X2 [Clupea harengus]|uniref:Platelet endothelial cell adhesion molecule n=1 Tax=Clupea harengus TaxID=7950 RepID=A0A6P8F7S6_CLUHA|nr:platelet endothelial cell adhesion molecule isoform X2 [Clupea harengus]